VVNALIPPTVLGFLFALSCKALPEQYRLKGLYVWVVGVTILVTVGFGLFSAISSIVT